MPVREGTARMTPIAPRHRLALHGVVCIYSLGSVCAKLAAGHPLFSGGFLCWYGALLFLLVVYALLWQQVIRHVPLNIAYASKGMVVVWTLVWAATLFGESILPNQLAGGALVLAGVWLVGTDA